MMLVFSLWNGALVRNPLDCSFYSDAAVLSSFVDNALTPLATALRGHPALAMWRSSTSPRGCSTWAALHGSPLRFPPDLTWGLDGGHPHACPEDEMVKVGKELRKRVDGEA